MNSKTKTRIVLFVSIGMNIFLGVFGGYDYLPDAYKDAVEVLPFVAREDPPPPKYIYVKCPCPPEQTPVPVN